MEFNLEQARKVLELTLADYSNIRAEYWARIYDAVYAYMSGSESIAKQKNEVKKAVAEAYNNTGDIAYLDGGADLPIDEETQAWLASRQEAELGYVDALFQNLKMERAEEGADPLTAAFKHADAYAKTLDTIYANIKCMAAGNEMLTFVGEDGQESCEDCKRYKNKTHRAKWWVAHDAVPPSRNFECKGYRCQHVLMTKDGRLFTI